MRIWLVDPSCFSPYYDMALVGALNRAGADATLITSRFLYQPDLVKEAPTVREAFFRSVSWPLVRDICKRSASVRRILKTLEYPLDWLWTGVSLMVHRPSLLHFQWVVHPAVDRWILRAIKMLGFRILYTAHNLVPHSSEDPRIGASLADVYRLADRILVHTESTAKELAAQLPDLAGRIGVVGHGPLHETVPPEPMDTARMKLGIDRDEQVVLFLGAISPYKGLDTLLDAFMDVATALPKALLLVVGQPEESLDRYLAKIRSAGLEGRVRLRAEFVPVEVLPLYYGAADVVALPYKGISQSGALFTAFRYGVPVVTSDAPAFVETFEQESHGLRVPSEDSKALAAAIVTILSETALRSRMRENIAQLCRERFSWETIARQTLEHYREVLGKDR